jgi:hypothetical protein
MCSTAWASGERVLLLPTDSPLRESLCISMNCVSAAPYAATVTTRKSGNAVRVTVASDSGQVRLTHRVPLDSSGEMAATDVLRAVALSLVAIENDRPTASAAPDEDRPRAASAAKKAKKAAKTAKHMSRQKRRTSA